MTAQLLMTGCVLGFVVAVVASQLRESYPRAATFGWVTLCTSAIALFGWQLLNLLDALDSGVLRVLSRSGGRLQRRAMRRPFRGGAVQGTSGAWRNGSRGRTSAS